MSAAPTPETPRKAILARMWREYIRPRWPWLAGAVAAAAVVAILTAQMFRLLEPAMNGLFVEQNREEGAAQMTSSQDAATAAAAAGSTSLEWATAALVYDVQP